MKPDKPDKPVRGSGRAPLPVKEANLFFPSLGDKDSEFEKILGIGYNQFALDKVPYIPPSLIMDKYYSYLNNISFKIKKFPKN